MLQLAAVLLLVAIVVRSRSHAKRAGLKLQNIAKQVAVRREDRVRIVRVTGRGAESRRDRACFSRAIIDGAIFDGESHDPAQLAAHPLRRVVRHLGGGHVHQSKNLILLLMCVELLLLAVNFNFVAFSRYLNDINGQIFVFFVLTVAAAESAIGLAILVLFASDAASTSKT